MRWSRDMAMHNAEIVRIFNEMADLLEIQNANPFRVRAYRTAALTISGLSQELSELIDEGMDLTELPGIGKDLANKIKVIVKTGKCPPLNALQKKIPRVLSDLMKIESLGPKRVKVLYKKLHIRTVKDLERALKNGKIRKLHGFGEKTEQRIKSGLGHVAEYSKRVLLSDVVSTAEALAKYLKAFKGTKEVICAGSYRRGKTTVGDLDFIATAPNPAALIDHFIHFDEVTKVLAHGPTRSTVRLRQGIQVDLRVVPQESYGAALVYFTGSKAHNIAIRKMAIKKKLKINEYGVFKGKKNIAGKTEVEVYKQIGLPFIEPELREDRGELKHALQRKLPKLVTLEDIRGDLHCHTKATDGTSTLEEMAKAAAAKGYDYLAITDHSKRLALVHGFKPVDLIAQIKFIDRLNAKLKNIVILKSIEADILEDGTLDLPDEILKELDLTVCSIHSKFNLSKQKQTERIIRAMDNPYFNILAHPTGRLINKRPEYEVNVEKIMRAAKERGCFLEINAQPERLDLEDVHCKMAKEMGLKLAISTDAHSASQLDFMRFGVYQARRGWLTAQDILNTRKLSELKKLLKRG